MYPGETGLFAFDDIVISQPKTILNGFVGGIDTSFSSFAEKYTGKKSIIF